MIRIFAGCSCALSLAAVVNVQAAASSGGLCCVQTAAGKKDTAITHAGGVRTTNTNGCIISPSLVPTLGGLR